MRTVEEAAGVRPAARPARLRRAQLRPRLRLRLRLRLCVLGAADWATWQARQADCACLLSFINLPWMVDGRWAGRERRAEGVLEMSNSDCGDRGLATRRGACVCELRHNYLLDCLPTYCTLHACPLPKSSPVARPRTDGSDLHRAIPLPRLPASTCALQLIAKVELGHPTPKPCSPGTLDWAEHDSCRPAT